MMTFRAYLRTIHQIGFADDANNVTLIVYHWYSADAPF
jgi:hypothetical protein